MQDKLIDIIQRSNKQDFYELCAATSMGSRYDPAAEPVTLDYTHISDLFILIYMSHKNMIYHGKITEASFGINRDGKLCWRTLLGVKMIVDFNNKECRDAISNMKDISIIFDNILKGHRENIPTKRLLIYEILSKALRCVIPGKHLCAYAACKMLDIEVYTIKFHEVKSIRSKEQKDTFRAVCELYRPKLNQLTINCGKNKKRIFYRILIALFESPMSMFDSIEGATRIIDWI
jgi:hypothetical protein